MIIICFNKYITGINNGKSQGEVVYSLVEQLNDKESITISQYNDIRAFFGISAFIYLKALM